MTALMENAKPSLRQQRQIAWCKLGCGLLFYTVTLALIVIAAMWWFHIVPIFNSHHEEVHAEKWRNRALFSARLCGKTTAQFVVVDCNATRHTHPVHRDHLNETLIRTVGNIIESVPLAHTVMRSWLQCDQVNSTCMTFVHSCMTTLHMPELYVCITALCYGPMLLTLMWSFWVWGPGKFKKQLTELNCNVLQQLNNADAIARAFERPPQLEQQQHTTPAWGMWGDTTTQEGAQAPLYGFPGEARQRYSSQQQQQQQPFGSVQF